MQNTSTRKKKNEQPRNNVTQFPGTEFVQIAKIPKASEFTDLNEFLTAGIIRPRFGFGLGGSFIVASEDLDGNLLPVWEIVKIQT